MRGTQHLNTRALILPVAALIALAGCKRDVVPPSPKVTANPSPIMVADGSMIVRTKSTVPSPAFDGTTLTIKGGFACAVIANGTNTNVKGLNWTITSNDKKGTISTADNGATILATSTLAGAASLPDDLIDGPGAEFQVKFSGANLNIKSPPSLDCGKKCCRVKIDYESSCP